MAAILKKTLTRYFYVLTNPNIKFIDFDFTYTPKKHEEKYVHIWNSDTTVRLFNRKQVKQDLSLGTDESLKKGGVELKDHKEVIYEVVPFDIVYLSYNETNSDSNFNKLRKRFPRIKRIHGVKGIFNAHKEAAEKAETPMFYVIDADADIVEDFDFSFMPHEHDWEYVHVWRSRNPVNKLEYGYGGIKLFPTKLLREAKDWKIDFTTSVARGLKTINTVSNITAFNTDPFSTWKSAFRESVKLASKIIPGQVDAETEARLQTWCTVGKGKKFGKYCLAGARAGSAYGKLHRDDEAMLNKINDFRWLEHKFERSSF